MKDGEAQVKALQVLIDEDGVFPEQSLDGDPIGTLGAFHDP